MQTKEFFRGVRNYFIGTLLMPWIWVWSLLAVLSFLIISYFGDVTDFSFAELQYFPGQMALLFFWLQATIITIINYSIDYYTRLSTPRLRVFLFYTNLLVLIILFIAFWPYFQESLIRTT